MGRGLTPVFAAVLLSVRLVLAADIPSESYRDASQPVEKRVKDLLGRMSLDQKIRQLSQDHAIAGTSREGMGTYCADTKASVEENAVTIRDAQKALRSLTPAIPALFGCEAVHGLMLRGATIYPQAIALGATWNPALVKEMGSQIAREASAVGITQALDPVLDLGRDPRYGRIEETYGECPTLVSRMGVAYITGMQGDDVRQGLAPDKVYCMTKHFAGYSIPANGINIAPVLIGEREMRTHHLIPFEAAVRDAHVMAVMPSYNSVDGIPSHANPWLLTDLLRREWGFEGYVYSDWSGIEMNVGHRVAADSAEAARLALTAGVDVDAPGSRSYGALDSLAQNKQLDIAVIDQAVARVLRAKFIAGLFDGKRGDGDPATVKAVVHCPAHVALARKLADESIILLKNDNNLLPLDATRLKSIAVIGPNANQVQFGDYSWTKSNEHGVNFLAALKNMYGEKLAVNYAKGCDLVGLSTSGFAAAVKAAGDSDVSVVVLGDTSMIFTGVGWGDPTVPANGTVGEGFDVNNPVLPGVQEDLLKAVAAVGKPVIVILLNGRPYCIPWVKEHVAAIIEAFYPGEQQGPALVDILFGKVNPSGRLPVTIARSAGHIPCTYDYKAYGRGFYQQPGSPTNPGRDYVFDTPAPLWPFGFGLSYTTFAYDKFSIENRNGLVPMNDGVLKLSFEVKNTGTVAGKATPQVYWRAAVGEICPPEKRLLCFEKVELQPGETRIVSFAVPVSEFRMLSRDMKWSVKPGSIELQLGDSAETISRRRQFRIVSNAP